MAKTDFSFDIDNYIPVAERIASFYHRFPLGRITTRLIERSDDIIIVRAAIYRSVGEPHPSATGWAAERPDDGEINRLACLENAETSAIGRALANLGFGTTRVRPRHAVTEAKPSAKPEVLKVRTMYGEPPQRVGRRATRSPDSEPVRSPPIPSLVRRDILRLLDDAERFGMRSTRAAAYRHRVRTEQCDDVRLERAEHALRNWIRSVATTRAENHERDDV